MMIVKNIMEIERFELEYSRCKKTGDFSLRASLRCLVVLVTMLLSSCAGIGYVETSDPYKKIDQAYSLMAEDRLLLAEDVIGQALEIFEANGDKPGIAEAYHTYGSLYKNDLYINGRWAVQFKKLGTYDGTYEKSIANFKKCSNLYEELGDGTGVAKCLMGAGNAYSIKGEREVACGYYQKSLDRYLEAKKTEADFVEPQIFTGYSNMGELIKAFIKHEPCGTSS